MSILNRQKYQWGVLLWICCCLLGPGCRSTDQESRDLERLSNQSPVSLTAEVDRAEATVIDPLMFRITLEADPEISVSLPDIGPQIQGLRIVDMGSKGPKRREGRIWNQRWYQLQADITGSYLLPAITVAYTDLNGQEQEAKTGQVFVEIKTVLEDDGQEQDIRALKPLKETAWQIPLSWLLGGLGVLIVIGTTTGILVYRQKRQKYLEQHLSSEDLAQRELDHLETTGLLEEQRYREYVFGLSLIFRRYLERKYQLPAAEQTTEEILVSLRKHQVLENRLKEMARNFLEETDPIKYRGIAPEREETENWRAQMLSFIEQAAHAIPEIKKEVA